jgi:hypothetical protein
MLSRKDPGRLSVPRLAVGVALVIAGNDAGARCALSGPAQIEDMTQAERTLIRDENFEVWVQAGGCDWHPVSDGAAGQAITQFRDVARDNGLGGGLRTFARNGNFRLYIDGMNAMELDAANRFLDKTPFAGTWRETARGGSPDATLLFAVGELALPKGRLYQYAQVWQFDPRTANWGMRLMLLRPMANR